MRTCEEYIEIISAVTDNEASPAERDEALAHMETCAFCRSFSEAFAGVSAILREEKEPPDRLAADITAKIKAAGPKRKNPRAGVIRYISIAACLAVIIFGAARSELFSGSRPAGGGGMTAGSAPRADQNGTSNTGGAAPGGAVAGGGNMIELPPAAAPRPATADTNETGEAESQQRDDHKPDLAASDSSDENMTADEVDRDLMLDAGPTENEIRIEAFSVAVSVTVRGPGFDDIKITDPVAVSGFLAILTVRETPVPQPDYEPSYTITVKNAEGDHSDVDLWISGENIIYGSGGRICLAAGTVSEFLIITAAHAGP
ncbi:MAG: zf-HC2 domain-containing protein [Oscillospiraceae bacterium]|nr:zf-HC2 domain-containing protein [Oscillospiraceae bacterium]